jgi:hypothetical protein
MNAQNTLGQLPNTENTPAATFLAAYGQAEMQPFINLGFFLA